MTCCLNQPSSRYFQGIQTKSWEIHFCKFQCNRNEARYVLSKLRLIISLRPTSKAKINFEWGKNTHTFYFSVLFYIYHSNICFSFSFNCYFNFNISQIQYQVLLFLFAVSYFTCKEKNSIWLRHFISKLASAHCCAADSISILSSITISSLSFFLFFILPLPALNAPQKQISWWHRRDCYKVLKILNCLNPK